ncbi:MAG TPA: hypothetical protein VJ180_04370 [Pyrinomonadaceae bacterium]|nr:hypothetical protein [Pyrinomonadaceae bacterium]
MPLRNPLRIIVRIIGSLVTVLVAAAVCFGCDCNDLSPPESFKAADLVFVGNVLTSNSSAAEATSTFRVEQVLKGTQTGQAVITSHMTNCDFSFQTGSTYIVYARQSDGKFFASTCMSTKVVAAQQTFIHYTSSPRWGYRAVVGGIVLLLALAVGNIVGRSWKRAA